MYRKLHKYTLISSIFCVISFFAVRFADTAILSIFLRFNHIMHKYSVFHIEYLPGSQNNWSEGKVILIYSVPYVLFAVAGIFLPHMVRRISNFNVHMAITWLSFQMVLLVLSGLCSGLFEFKGIGVIMEWLFVNKAVRVMAAAILLMLILFSARRFAWYFLQNVPHRTLHDDFDQRKFWMNRVLFYPFLISFLFILPFTDIHTWLNFSFTLLTGLIFIGVIYHSTHMVYIPGTE